MGNDWEVHVDYQTHANKCDIYIFRNLTDGRELITEFKNGEIVLERLAFGAIVPNPTMSIRGQFIKPFLQAFADVCYKEGIMPEKQPIIENELTATKYHLEDMRKLLKIK